MTACKQRRYVIQREWKTTDLYEGRKGPLTLLFLTNTWLFTTVHYCTSRVNYVLQSFNFVKVRILEHGEKKDSSAKR